MPSLRILALFPLLALATLSAQTSHPPGPLAPVLQSFIDTHVAAGLVVLVADKHQVLDLEAVGYSCLSTKTPMKVDDLFWIASMSKSVTATAFMMLVDENKLNIKDPVEKYLPEFKGQMVVDETDPTHTPRPSRHPITIEEILSHTSGISQELTGAQRGARDDFSLQKEVADYAAIPLKRQPFTKYEYSNAGIDTVGRILEVVSGMPYADFLQQRLFDPLGMKDTTFWPNQEQGSRLACSTRLTPDGKNIEDVNFDTGQSKVDIDKLELKLLGSDEAIPTSVLSNMGISAIFDYKMRYAMPAGGIYSTASDLARLYQMLLNGGVYHGKRFLSENAVRQMTSVHTGNVYPNTAYGYGLGWEIKRTTEDLPSAGSFGHRGARDTRVWIDPAKNLVMVLLMQSMDLPGRQEQQLDKAFLNAAEQKYGTGAAQ